MFLSGQVLRDSLGQVFDKVRGCRIDVRDALQEHKVQKRVAEFRKHELVRAFECHLVIGLAAFDRTPDVAALDFGECVHITLNAPQVFFADVQMPHNVGDAVAVVVVCHHIDENSYHSFAASLICHKASCTMQSPRGGEYFLIYKK